NQFRMGYGGSLTSTRVTLPGVPAIYLDDSTLGFGSGGELPESFHESIYTFSDSIALNRGKHDVKLGVELHRNIENGEANFGRPSYYFFDPLFFAIDAPYGEDAGVDPGIIRHQPPQLASSIRHWRDWEIGLYGEDNWKVKRRFTLNLGLR